MSKSRYHPLKWIIWSLAVSFYFYEYFIRVFPSVIADELISYYKISAIELGSLSAFYLYAYAPMQLPVGVLVDRYGARRLLTMASLVCGLATLLFSITQNLVIADLTRVLMGAGSAFGFIGMVYISSHWFSGKKLAFLVGIGNSIGMLGAVCGLALLGYTVQIFHWQTILYTLGILGIALAIVIFLVVRNEPKEVTTKTTEERISIKESAKIVLSNPQSWINAIVCFLFYVTTSAFAGLWATPFLSNVHQFTLTQAATASSMIYVGFIIGGPIIGHLSDRFGSRKFFLLTLPTIAFFLIIPTIYLAPLSFPIMLLIMFFIGFCSSPHLLNFSLAIELNPEKCKGFSLAFANFINFLGGALIQTFIGYLIDLHSSHPDGTTTSGYSVESFQFALSILPITFILGFIFTLFIKEKKHISHIYYQ